MAKIKFTKPIKVRHFAAKTVDLGNSVVWESFMVEVLVAFLLAIFAYQGYKAKLALLLFPCAIGCVACTLIAGRTLYLAIKAKLEAKKSANQKT